MITGIHPDHLDMVWRLAAPKIARALPYAHGKYSLEYLYDAIKKTDCQLWMGEKFAGVTQIVDYPEKRTCCLMFCGGDDIDEWKDTLSVVEEWASSIGCEAMEIWGRRGWQKVLPGYNEIHAVMGKELCPAAQ